MSLSFLRPFLEAAYRFFSTPAGALLLVVLLLLARTAYLQHEMHEARHEAQKQRSLAEAYKDSTRTLRTYKADSTGQRTIGARAAFPSEVGLESVLVPAVRKEADRQDAVIREGTRVRFQPSPERYEGGKSLSRVSPETYRLQIDDRGKWSRLRGSVWMTPGARSGQYDLTITFEPMVVRTYGVGVPQEDSFVRRESWVDVPGTLLGIDGARPAPTDQQEKPHPVWMGLRGLAGPSSLSLQAEASVRVLAWGPVSVSPFASVQLIGQGDPIQAGVTAGLRF